MKTTSEILKRKLQDDGFEIYSDAVNSLIGEVCEWIDICESGKDVAPVCTLCGDTGIGKTTIARAIRSIFDGSPLHRYEDANGFARYRECDFIYGPDAASMAWNGESMILNGRLRKPWFLIYDDFGREFNRMDVVEGYMIASLEHRINSGRKTIITTNLGLDVIEKQFDQRLTSRLIRNGSKFISTSIKDYSIK